MPELPLPYHPRQIPVGGSNHPAVHRDRPGTAQSLYLAALQDPSTYADQSVPDGGVHRIDPTERLGQVWAEPLVIRSCTPYVPLAGTVTE